jgi:hypothetical protein
MRRRNHMPSSLIVYRSPRPYTPFTKLTKSQWQGLYRTALRLGYEVAPAAPSLVPSRAIIEYTGIQQGATASNVDLFPPDAIGSSLMLFSAQLSQLGQAEDPPVIYLTCRLTALVSFTTKALALTPNVCQEPGVFFLFRLMVFPSDVSQGPRLVPMLVWQLVAGALTNMNVIASLYMNEVRISLDPYIEASISACHFMDNHEMPFLSVTTLRVQPE